MITNGTSNTGLVAHRGTKPQDYAGGGANDQDFDQPSGVWSDRCWFNILQDSNTMTTNQDANNLAQDSDSTQGSSHPSGAERCRRTARFASCRIAATPT